MLQRIADEETGNIGAAATMIAEAIEAKHNIFASGASHSSLPVQEIVYRSGGLMLFNPLFGPGIDAVTTRPTTLGTALEQLPGFGKAILDNSPLKAGDVLIIVSVSGRNNVPVEIAQLAKGRGIKVIAVTSEAYSDAVTSRHESGQKLKDFADIVLDNKVPVGDAVLSLPGVPQKFTPASGVTTTALMHTLSAAVIEELAKRGITPPVFLSANVDGGQEWNEKLLAENRERIFYL